MIKILIAVIVITFAAFFLTGSAPAKETIKIGAIYPFTGQMAAYAEDAKRALDFAQEEINAGGGINGNEVKFILEDDGGTPKGGVSAAQKLIEIDRVDALIGCLFSSVALAVKPILNTNKTVLLAPLASAPRIYEGTKYIFGLTSTDRDYCYVNAKYCTQILKKKTLGTLYMMNDAGIDQDHFISKWWEHFAGRVLVHESFTPGSTDFRTQLAKIREAAPEMIYLSVTWREGVNVLKQISEMNLKSQITANSQIREEKLLELVGPTAEGMVFSDSFVAVAEKDKQIKEKFDKGFTARYKQPPGIVGYRTYEGTRVLFEAMKRGGTRGDKLRDTMAKMDMPGMAGQIRFREDGSPIRQSAMWMVKDGKFFDLNYIDAAP